MVDGVTSFLYVLSEYVGIKWLMMSLPFCMYWVSITYCSRNVDQLNEGLGPQS